MERSASFSYGGDRTFLFLRGFISNLTFPLFDVRTLPFRQGSCVFVGEEPKWR